VTRARLPLGVILAAFLLTACAHDGRPVANTAPDAPIPTYETIRAANDERTALLDRFWTRTVARIDFVDEDGKERSEQLEGHLQFAAPRGLLVTFHKLGELYFVVGSNDDLFWWIQLGSDKRATVGRYDSTNPQEGERFGLLVHPLDLITLLAIRPMPEAPLDQPRWSDEHQAIEVDLPAISGTRRMYFDPETLEPTRVELLDDAGELTAESTLTRYTDVTVDRPVEGPTPRIAQRFWITSPSSDLSIKVDIYAAVTNDERPRPRDLDFEHLIRAYRVDEVEWLEGG
jgi:hypothetical protein